METLKNLNKFWRNSTLLPSATTAYNGAAELVCEEEEEEDESLFELEMVMLNCCRSVTRGAGRDKEDESLCLRPKEREGNMSRVRVVPTEPDVKPQSPISLLKSAPKLRVSFFKKTKTELTHPDLKISNSSSRSEVLKPEAPSDSSKRFSKDVMHKYLKLKLTKPFNVRVAKRSASVTKSRLFDTTECPAPAGGLRGQLGKSRSASSVSAGAVCRRDESVLEHDDGIQSAILHCKRSLNSSRGRGVSDDVLNHQCFSRSGSSKSTQKSSHEGGRAFVFS